MRGGVRKMTGRDLRMSGLVRNGLLAGFGLVILALERRRRARTYVEPVPVHAGRNLMLAGMAAATVQLLEAPVVMPVARAVVRRRIGVLQRMGGPVWMRDVAAVLLLDYTLYLWHALTHRVPWLWRFHLVHHVDLDMDATTGLRFHAGELTLSVPWRAAQVLALGVSPRALVAWQTLTLGSVLFHHSNVRLPFRLERLIARLLVTPRMHAVHHAADDARRDVNFSSGLSVWDRLHGTFELDPAAHDTELGVEGYATPRDVRFSRLLTLPVEKGKEGRGQRAEGCEGKN